MKDKPILIILLVAAGFGLAAVIGATNGERIRWDWHGSACIPWTSNEHGSLQFGLRNDGVVVWREIHPATTNSPAEDNTIRIDSGGTNVWIGTNNIIQPWYPYTITNIPMTNFYNLNGTPNGMTPENTNDWERFRIKP